METSMAADDWQSASGSRENPKETPMGEDEWLSVVPSQCDVRNGSRGR